MRTDYFETWGRIIDQWFARKRAARHSPLPIEPWEVVEFWGSADASRRQSDVRVLPRVPVSMEYETAGIRK